jgi:hypothetical protein
MRASHAFRISPRRSIPVHLSVALLAAFGLVLLSARPAHATIKGGCTASATGTVSGGPIDLTTATDWNLVNEDIVTGHGSTAKDSAGNATELKGVRVRVDLFGLPLTILSGDGKGTGGSAGPYSVSSYSRIARVVGASGEAGGGVCTGSIKITVTNISPLATVAGGGGTVLGVVALIVLVLLLFSGGGAGSRILGGLIGLLGGIGFGLLLQQTGTLSPTSLAGLIVPAIGLIAGVSLPGLLSRKPAGG